MGNGFNQQGFDRRWIGGFGRFDARFKVLQQVFCGFDACIGQ